MRKKYVIVFHYTGMSPVVRHFDSEKEAKKWLPIRLRDYGNDVGFTHATLETRYYAD